MSASVTLPAGFQAAGIHCGLKKQAADPDLGLLLADQAFPAAAMFTRNLLLGAHVTLCREHLRASGGRVRAVLVNAKNANCATGAAGVADARTLCEQLARRIGCATTEVLMLSTGVIGARLPMERITSHLDALLAAASRDGARDFARAIMTTDTHEKIAATAIAAGAGDARVTGFAKGAGMIHPDMATMLAFLLTDGAAPDLGSLLERVVDQTFHRLSIDGDTSPNDTVILWASGQRAAAQDRGAALEAAATSTARDLARAIATDGEGATRLLTIRVRGAASTADAARAGRVIATSPLVKTAIAGRDPNWGRIVSAAGRAGVAFDPDRAILRIGDACVYHLGIPRPQEEPVAHRHLVDDTEIVLDLDLGVGQAQAEVWSCDLTKDYVQINADYRT